ncbi:MAG: amino acid ABC transporter permease [Janthinobacterium lividum]
MNFSLDFMLSSLPIILKGLSTTAWVTVLSSLGAAVLGFSWELLRRSGRTGGYAMRLLIDLLRSTPILVQIYFLFFVLPYWGVTLPAGLIGVLALSVYYSGYLAEVFKAGIDGVRAGQFQAAAALGLSRLDTMLLIVAPQMLRNIAAPMGSYFISILKATPYLAVVAVHEMLGAALDIGSDTFRYAEPMVSVGLIFLALALVIAWLVSRLEAHLLAPSKR